MADTTNINLLLNSQTAKSSKSLRSNYISHRTSNLNYKNTGSFNNVLDRISTPTERSTSTDNFGATNRTSNDYSRQNTRTNDRSTVKQSTSTRNDAAPDDAEPIENVEDELDAKPSAPIAPLDEPVMFTMSTETLLAVRDVPTNDEPVLMTVLPQQSNANNQSMLNMLAGNTWRAVEPTAIEPENIPSDGLIASTAPVMEEIRPLDIAPQSIIDPRGAEQIADENMTVELGQLPTKAQETTVEPLVQTVERQIGLTRETLSEPTVETPAVDAQPIDPRGVQSQTTVAQSERDVSGQMSKVDGQPIVERADASSQAQVISNDANLSNVIDAAKNSQPKLVTDEFASNAPALDE